MISCLEKFEQTHSKAGSKSSAFFTAECAISFTPCVEANILPVISDGTCTMMNQKYLRRTFVLGAIAAGAVVAATLALGTGSTLGPNAIRMAQRAGENVGTTFSATPTSGAAPLTVSFHVSPSVVATIDFGDGTNGTMAPAPTCATCPSLAVAAHTYESSGTYTAKIVSGAVALASQVITVVSRP